MRIKIVTNFIFTATSIQYMHGNELCIELRNPPAATTDVCEERYEYIADLGEVDARPRPVARLMEYAKRQLDRRGIKGKNKTNHG